MLKEAIKIPITKLFLTEKRYEFPVLKIKRRNKDVMFLFAGAMRYKSFIFRSNLPGFANLIKGLRN